MPSMSTPNSTIRLVHYPMSWHLARPDTGKRGVPCTGPKRSGRQKSETGETLMKNAGRHTSFSLSSASYTQKHRRKGEACMDLVTLHMASSPATSTIPNKRRSHQSSVDAKETVPHKHWASGGRASGGMARQNCHRKGNCKLSACARNIKAWSLHHIKMMERCVNESSTWRTCLSLSSPIMRTMRH